MFVAYVIKYNTFSIHLVHYFENVKSSACALTFLYSVCFLACTNHSHMSCVILQSEIAQHS